MVVCGSLRANSGRAAIEIRNVSPVAKLSRLSNAFGGRAAMSTRVDFDRAAVEVSTRPTEPNLRITMTGSFTSHLVLPTRLTVSGNFRC